MSIINEPPNKLTSTTTPACPKIIFIVPYRNRPQHKYFFLQYMTHTILRDYDPADIAIYFAHQADKRSFNRGAMKNIGFLAVRAAYPAHYRDMTFVFNDVDTIPYAPVFNYQTRTGIVKHFYGFDYALGGIVAMTGADFERINGFPNYWGWGMEDKVLQIRCLNHGLRIDRSQFYSIGSPEILQLFDGVERLINPFDMERSNGDAERQNGIASIGMLSYRITTGDQATTPNEFVLPDKEQRIPVFFINTTYFQTGSSFEREKQKLMYYDLRGGANKMAKNFQVDERHIVQTPDTWKHIPKYPSVEQQHHLVKTLGSGKAHALISRMYYSSNTHNLKTTHVKSIRK